MFTDLTVKDSPIFANTIEIYDGFTYQNPVYKSNSPLILNSLDVLESWREFSDLYVVLFN